MNVKRTLLCAFLMIVCIFIVRFLDKGKKNIIEGHRGGSYGGREVRGRNVYYEYGGSDGGGYYGDYPYYYPYVYNYPYAYPYYSYPYYY